MDRKHEHRSGRQQKTVFDVGGNHSVSEHNQSDIRTDGLGSCVSGHGIVSCFTIFLFSCYAKIVQVSRCGMIYMEPASLGWEPLLTSWKNTLPTTIRDFDKKVITDLFMRFCPVLLYFIRKGGVFVSHQTV